ncbi:MAG: M1 family aminopeptidase [Terriglobales bacterium]
MLILATVAEGFVVTKVLVRPRRMFNLTTISFPRTSFSLMCLLLFALTLSLALVSAPASAQSSSDRCPSTAPALYERLGIVGLDPSRVYHVRGASIHRPSLDITLDDGTIAFTEDICGRTTGAFFVGDGEILLQPPNRVERASLTLFTGTAILEEQLSSGYLRFNDDTASELQPFLSPAPGSADFLQEWSDTIPKLADFDATRLLLDFSHFLPSKTPYDTASKLPSLLHAHLIGKTLGGFDVFWDAAIPESLWAGKPQVKDGIDYFDIWTSFSPPAPSGAAPPAPRVNQVSIGSFKLQAWVTPPTHLRASADLDVRVRNGGQRTLLFELSRYLKIESVESAGHPVDFIQNPAIEGTQLRRKGNDLVAIIFPAALKNGENLKLSFHYAGDVLSDAGNGLLYVGERGTWYPSFGLSHAQFDIVFHYPAEWTLLATGKKISRTVTESRSDSTGEKVSHWISERPIPVAGFNLGRYTRAEAKAGSVLVEAYATRGVERTFPTPPTEIIEPPVTGNPRTKPAAPPIAIVPSSPSPARDVRDVANRAANAIETFTQWFGPYPYSSLALTQMPGDLSQGWPGLVFLSSAAFLSPQEQHELHLDPVTSELNRQVLVHETAHEWWGDLVVWKSYRDQWLAEGLANYSSLLLLEQKSPEQFHAVMERYRKDLLSKNKDGEWLRDAGPVTLGQRLISSHFPNGYEAISYERGTWLFHMLRSMMRDSEMAVHSRKAPANPDEPFFRALRKARDRFAGKAMSTHDLIQVFEEELPRPLWYNNHHSLDWFVDGWINGTAIPEIAVRETHITGKAGETIASGLILLKNAPDNLVTAVPVYGAAGGNSLVFLGEVLADGPETLFHFNAPEGIHKIVVDPNQTILSALK